MKKKINYANVADNAKCLPVLLYGTEVCRYVDAR